MSSRIMKRTFRYFSLDCKGSYGSFSSVVMPRDTVFSQESKQTIPISNKPFLVGQNQVCFILLVYDDLSIEDVYLLLKFMQVPSFQTIILYRFHNGDNEISHFYYECLIFFIKRIFLQIVIQISNEVHPTFLLSAFNSIIAGVKI